MEENATNSMDQFLQCFFFFLTEQVTVVTITVLLWINVWVTTPLLINPTIIFFIFFLVVFTDVWVVSSSTKKIFLLISIPVWRWNIWPRKIVRKCWKVPVNILQGLTRPFQPDQQSRNTKIISLLSCMTKKNSKSSAEDVWSSFD